MPPPGQVSWSPKAPQWTPNERMARVELLAAALRSAVLPNIRDEAPTGNAKLNAAFIESHFTETRDVRPAHRSLAVTVRTGASSRLRREGIGRSLQLHRR